MKLNPKQLANLQDEIDTWDNTKGKSVVEKQLKAYKKAQQSYAQITEKTAERINRANESTR